VDRLVLKAMPDKSSKAQIADGKAAFFGKALSRLRIITACQGQHVPLSCRGDLVDCKNNLIATNCFAANA
jgi:hypothetical protein